MAMGTRQSEQASLWVATSDLPKLPGHPFYMQLSALLDVDGFDRFVEDLCARFYAPVMGRPSVEPGQLAPFCRFRTCLGEQERKRSYKVSIQSWARQHE
jgi:hypothetical protein